MIRAAVVGATGYTGAELVRLLAAHPEAELVALVGHSTAGEPVGSVLPSLQGLRAGVVRDYDPAALADEADAVFCALPHGASAPKVAELRGAGLKVFDLSADFRLRDLALYREWYGDHGAPELVGGAAYGLPELHRAAIREADLVAVPGCYPTASVLPVAPLLAEGLLAMDGPIVIDAKTGVSGAGRGAKARTHLPETAEGIRAYGIAGRHRHTPEIEQELSRLADREVRVIFSPHLAPMTRGILATIYLRPAAGVDAARCTEAARAFFEGSPSVHVLEPVSNPDTLWVRGSNRAHVSYTDDARSGWVVAQGAIDNLVKGAAGQALQCLNLRFGLEEGAGLRHPATWP
ncbi:MAG TPA: N-acetyl-gamma-glutamyl-phosphate reductase [Sandaracinaceae bacterium LLY-WYZ-13_1]|nr:N-acetyl-gamma-glutamyl-phosphate reductase [Sandaracinaceae bacterium LLY-WYZ-13_1]